MKYEYLSIQALPAWARLNGVSLSGVAFRRFSAEEGTDRGSAIVCSADKGSTIGPVEDDGSSCVLLTVQSDLVLSLQAVEDYAKSDPYLREVLEAVGEMGRTARGAILIFLLIHLSYSSPDFTSGSHKIGVSNAWTEYLKFMPASVPLPTFYSAEERELLRGTSLKPALDAKLASLDREFEHLRQCTEGIAWCQEYWWDEEKGTLRLDDWKYVDALYRSRSVDLPGSGHSMVPCIDMANHASEGTVKALYETDASGKAVLQLRSGKTLNAGEEVTISYGASKSAAEMIFSYGFLEDDRVGAGNMVVPFDISDDDPLKLAKKMFHSNTSGIHVSAADSTTTIVDWSRSLVWWASVNEEDGLDFKVLQTTDGDKELRAIWKGEDVDTPAKIGDILAAESLWEVFQLRAVVTIITLLESQLAELHGIDEIIADFRRDEAMLKTLFDPDVFRLLCRFRVLEAELLKRGIDELFSRRTLLLRSETVIDYLKSQQEDDFS
ncbi:hypothetical protein ASPZODRAFT_13069 [Penicilliopsis zonata CBS 506.65]|uniref:SET domain-containing protein n=1 Tax=Penicilliopsis zonata CBS 506.65 TaxID=1073090 RepID=A0A1L9SS58_9EURO|nr:hypothetical protein ASPZODRAFT_13069 [Penicilliopsis zonata CBS 506.65]OJJ49964.1 hypothetical protein ASPZODRAFT_13069 [Penicilliopsis zonata CBS 506.65]